MKLTPYIHFNGDAEEALHFYKEVFHGEIISLNRYGDSPMTSGEAQKNKIIHSRLQFGDNLIMISDSMEGHMMAIGGNVQLSVEVHDKVQMETVFSQLAAGGKITMPLQDQFWGATFGMLVDKFGVSWMFNHENKMPGTEHEGPGR